MAGPLTQESIIADVAKAAKDLGEDSFKLKIFRKRDRSALPEHIITLDGATVNNIANAELWLPKLLGGGIYQMNMYHSSDTTKPVGGLLTFQMAGEPRATVDIGQVKHGDWAGPSAIAWITDGLVQNQDYRIGAIGAPPVVPPGMAPQPTSHGQPGVPSYDPSGAISAYLSSQQQAQLQERRHLEQIQAMKDQIAARERELEESKRRTELETLRLQNESRLHDLEAKLVAARPVEKGFDVERLLTAISPIVMEMMRQQQETRLHMMKLDAERASQFQAILTQQLQRPPIDPAVEKMMDKVEAIAERSKSSDPNGNMVANMSTAMTTMVGTLTSVMKMASDLELGGRAPDEPTGLKVFREVSKAIGSLMQGYQASMEGKAAPQPGQAALPPATRAGQPQSPLPVGAQPAAQPAAQPQPTLIDRVEHMIKSRIAPAQVAATFIHGIQSDDPSIRTALSGVDGDVGELVKRRLGTWAVANMDYLGALMETVNSEGEKAGLWDEEEDGAESASDASAGGTDTDVDTGGESVADDRHVPGNGVTVPAQVVSPDANASTLGFVPVG